MIKTMYTLILICAMFAPFIYILFLLEWLYIAAMFFLILSGFGLAIALIWMYDCRNKSGCFSGVIFILPLFTAPVGLVLLLADYLLS